MLKEINRETNYKEVSSTPVVMSLSPDGYILSSTNNAEEYFQLTISDVSEYNFFDFIFHEDIPKCEKIIDSLTQGLTFEINCRINSREETHKTTKGVVFQLPEKYSRVLNELIWVSIPQKQDLANSLETVSTSKYNFVVIEDITQYFFNSELVQLLNIQNDAKLLDIIYDSNKRSIDLENIFANLPEGEIIAEDFYLKNKDDKYILFSVSILKHSLIDKEVLIFILNETKPNESKYLSVNNSDIFELQEKINSRDKFFSLIAHDLRSPFTAILGYSEYMSSYYENLTREEIHDFSNNMYKASKSVFKLLEDLLKWTRIQSGKITLDKEIFSIVPTLDRAVEMFKASAEKKDIRLIYNSSDFEILVNADEEMISSVFRNLISNAIKFTEPKGFVKINLALENRYVIVSFIDNGLGIDKVTLSKLFKVGERVTRYGTNDEEGSGLGLILSKEFIEKNSGDIQVESRVGEGSSFSVSLPIETSKEKT